MQNFERLKKLVDRVIGLNICVIELKNRKFKTEPIIIGLIWFGSTLKKKKLITRIDSNQIYWFDLDLRVIGSIQSAYSHNCNSYVA